MKRIRLFLMFVVVSTMVVGGMPMAFQKASAFAVPVENLSAETIQQLSRARRGTAKYHDISQAQEDGYVNINIYESGEGLHLVNFSLIDGTFDPEHPEVLLYMPSPTENRMQLIAVEYVVPLGLSISAPSGFAGDNDVWRENSEGLGLWELDAWIWLSNSDGVFAFKNQRVP